ncbi:hypothetical protein O1L55_16940 [Streptomyces albulus]|nr:hypothetical protein [Streptomyces noursei]
MPAGPAVPVRARLTALADRAVAPVVAVSFLAAVASLGLYTYLAPVLAAAGGVQEVTPYLWAWAPAAFWERAVRAAGRPDRAGADAGRRDPAGGRRDRGPAADPGGVALPGAVVALLAWGAAGWAFQVPQQHRLLRAGAQRGTVALALNNSALYLGSAVGSALGGLALAAGWRRTRCPGRRPAWRPWHWWCTWRRADAPDPRRA